MKWSYSALKQYTTCPRQYYEVRVAKNYTTSDTVQSRYGKDVHKAFEEYMAKGKPLAKNYERFKPVVDILLEIGGDRYTEKQLAVTASLTPCDFDDEDYWVRGIVDLLIITGNEAYIIDYKTGSSRYADPNQLKLMALLTFMHFPQVQNINAGLLFVTSSSFVPEEYQREDVKALLGVFDIDLLRLERSFKTNKWDENPNGLCRKHCPVTSCQFNGMR